jgi:hypothetical protein
MKVVIVDFNRIFRKCSDARRAKRRTAHADVGDRDQLRRGDQAIHAFGKIHLLQ